MSKPHHNTIFLILSNVKILSPLKCSKMKRNELFSKNGDSTHTFWKLCQLWNSVSFFKQFFYIYLSPAKSSWKKTTKFSNFQRTVFFFTAHCNFISSAVEILSVCAANKITACWKDKHSGKPRKKQFALAEMLRSV